MRVVKTIPFFYLLEWIMDLFGKRALSQKTTCLALCLMLTTA